MNSFLFDEFKSNLGFNRINWQDGVFDVYLVYKADDLNINKMTKHETLLPLLGKKIGKLQGLTFETVNSITNLTSTNYYEAVESYPASAYIFSKECPDNQVKKDWDYAGYDNTHYDTYKKLNDDNFNNYHWEKAYSFNNYYSEAEYAMYNIPLHPISEDVCKLKYNQIAYIEYENFSGSLPKGEAAIIYYTEKKSKISCPVCYTEFDSMHDANDGPMLIEWIDKILELK